MTFIISKIVDGKFINHSDSMITDSVYLQTDSPPTDIPNKNPFSSILKTVIIFRNICISYAGTVHYANECLKEILNLPKSYKVADILTILKKYSIESNKETIFGLAIINKNQKIRQAKIHGNNIQDYTDSLMWLGDSRAYEVFNKKYQELLQQNKPEKESLQIAFDSVINNEKIDSVGHFGIVTTTIDQEMTCTSTTGEATEITQKIFEYSMKASMNLTKQITFHWKEKNKPEPIPVDLEKDDVEGISYFTTTSPSKFGVAIYNLKEKKGILLCPQIKVEPEIFEPDFGIVKGESIRIPQQDFIDEIYKKYKLPMKGMILLNDMGMKYIINFQKDEPRS